MLHIAWERFHRFHGECCINDVGFLCRSKCIFFTLPSFSVQQRCVSLLGQGADLNHIFILNWPFLVLLSSGS